MSFSKESDTLQQPESMPAQHYILVFFSIFMAIFLIGCSSGDSRVVSELAVVQDNIDKLRLALERNRLRNATFVKQYASILRVKRPELVP